MKSEKKLSQPRFVAKMTFYKIRAKLLYTLQFYLRPARSPRPSQNPGIFWKQPHKKPNVNFVKFEAVGLPFFIIANFFYISNRFGRLCAFWQSEKFGNAQNCKPLKFCKNATLTTNFFRTNSNLQIFKPLKFFVWVKIWFQMRIY